MQINFNYSDINSIDTTREEVDGIYSNAFPPFSQNSLGCRYGFLKNTAELVMMQQQREQHVHLCRMPVSRANRYLTWLKHFILCVYSVMMLMITTGTQRR